jgi:alpha-L-fucosidase
VHSQIRELLTNYGPIDILWLDGWWPFNSDGWQAKKMNAMARRLQPNILINDRNCLPNDFGTIEQHLHVPTRDVWEACFTLNDHWSYHPHDHNWKSPHQVIDMLLQCARAGGNLLINVGPRGDGTIPAPTKRILRDVGAWVHANEQSLRPGLIKPAMDWNHATGQNFTAKPGVVYAHVTAWPGATFTIRGVRGKVTKARFVEGGKSIKFEQSGDRLALRDLPRRPPSKLPTVIALEHTGKLSSYQTGGMRVPRVDHPQYDPV